MSLDAPAQAAKAMAETRQQPPPTARARDATDRTCGSLRLCNRRVSTRRAASRARNLPRGCARRRHPCTSHWNGHLLPGPHPRGRRHRQLDDRHRAPGSRLRYGALAGAFRAGMPEGVDADVLATKVMCSCCGGREVAGEAVFKGVAAEPGPSSGGEQRIAWAALVCCDGECGQRGSAFLAALAHAVHVHAHNS
jgi:hypothetical protein